MKKTGGLLMKWAGVAAMAALLSVSAFADSRHTNETRGRDEWRNDNRRGDNGRYDRGNNRSDHRDNGRYEQRGDSRGGRQSYAREGRIRELRHERGGYRVQLDRGSEWFFIPEASYRGWRGRGRGLDLRVGVNIRFGGYWDPAGYIYVDSIDDYYGGGYRDDGYGYGREYVSGTVQRIDEYRGLVLLREERTGRTIEVSLRRADGRRSVDLNDLRRGDFVEVSGDWLRGGRFEAYRIEGVRSGRW